jgi:hypothetical protein
MFIGVTLFPFLSSSPRKEQTGMQQTTDLTFIVFLRPFIITFEGGGGLSGRITVQISLAMRGARDVLPSISVIHLFLS